MTPRRPWSAAPKGGRRSILTVERIILALFVAGTWIHHDTHTDDAALVPPHRERPLEPRHSWRLVDGRSWQIVDPPEGEGGTRDEADDEARRGACPRGMVEVSGRMKVERPGSEPIEDLQNTTCTTWLQREFPERCARFDEHVWRSIAASLPSVPMRFCIDRFEYPNIRGEYPVILVTWREAKGLCASRGERLCTEDEWTFACEGEDAMPYPYGYDRDPNACVVDRSWIAYDETALRDRSSQATMRELDALWQGTRSGSSPACRSPFGVYDMTGNVDEWTESTRREGLPSIFKGGYWGPVRARCRPSTRVHDPDYAFYQQGLRCCASPSGSDGGATEDAATAGVQEESGVPAAGPDD
jgi:hypothetical protein